MILQELRKYFENKGVEEKVTYEQIQKEFPYKALTYHHLASLIREGIIDKIQSGEIFLYRLHNNTKDDR